MRFGIDAHAIGRHLTGNEVYVRNLLKSFAKLDEQSEFFTYLSVPGAEAHVPASFKKRWVSDNPFLRLGFQLARQLRRDKPDLIHVQYTAPLFTPVPIIASVHDVSYLEHPEFFTQARSRQLKITVERTVRNAAHVLTLSEFSRHRIAFAYGVNPERVTVVPAACSEVFRPTSRPAARAFVDGRFQIRNPYILSVGDLQPRKNAIGLIRAFEHLVANHPDIHQHLVLVGKDTWFSAKVHQTAERSPFGNRIHFTGYVNDKEMLQLYNASDIFVFPSFYEGFGIPILEAMACGRAVACSNTSAMPEVADSAALLFDPKSLEGMAGAMRDLLRNSELRARMERLGQQNAARFSWNRTAAQTLNVYREVAGRSAKEKPILNSAMSRRP